MIQKSSLRRIKQRSSYSTEELASLLKVHIQTIREWRREGLQAIDTTTHPFLFEGTVVINFLKEKLNKRKVKLLDGEFYCLPCKKAVKPDQYEEIDRGISIGKGKTSIVFRSKCPICNREVNRFGSKPILKVSELTEKESYLASKDSYTQEKVQIQLFDY